MVVMMLMVVVMMLMVVAITVMIVMVMLMVVAIAVMIVVVFVIVAIAVMVVVMMLVIVVVMLCFLRKLLQHIRGGVAMLHGGKDLLTGQLVPGCGDQGGVIVSGTDQLHCLGKLFLGDAIGVAEDHGVCVLDLVSEELAEVLHIHLALVGIHNGGIVAKSNVLPCNPFHGTDHIAELAYTGGLDEDTIGSKLRKHLPESFGEISHQATTNTAGIHLGDLDACILQEAAVDTDLAELVFDEHQLLACVGFFDEFFNQRRFSRAQKAGENIDLRHTFISFDNRFVQKYIIARIF
jgi:hypothetical protein